jgi:hypothetical protein
MTRPRLEHILPAAGAITGADRFVVIGSQAILGQFPNPPLELLVSVEADIFSLHASEDAHLIDGSIGEASPFHQTFGYYAHGVAEETATLPQDWNDRLLAVRTPATGGTQGCALRSTIWPCPNLSRGGKRTLNMSVPFSRTGWRPPTLSARGWPPPS